MNTMFDLGVTLILLVGAYLIGSYLERRHFANIRRREKDLVRFPFITLKRPPQGVRVSKAKLVSGNVVVSLDYFKRFLAGLRGLVGGRISAYETLLDRARREALLRMREQAQAAGYDMVINVRLESARLASAARDGKGTAGVEVFAFGTALKTEPLVSTSKETELEEDTPLTSPF